MFVGGGYAGLEALAELQDFAAEAMQFYPRARLHGMRWVLVEAGTGSCRRSTPSSPSTRCASSRSSGIDIRLGTTLEEVTADGRGSPQARRSPPARWSGPRASCRIRAAGNFGLPLDERGRIVVDDHLRVEGEQDVWAIGDAAAVPDPARPGLPCPPTSQHAIRQGRTAGRNVAASLGSAGEALHLPQQGPVREPRPLQGGGKGRSASFRGFPAWWLARTLPHEPDPGHTRKVRAVMDWTVGLPFGRDIAEVGSIGHPRPLRADAYAASGTHRALARNRATLALQRRQCSTLDRSART